MELLVGTFEGGLAAVAAGAGPRGAAAAAVDPAKASWRRLGFLSFDSNERSSFTARELKSVALNGTPAHLLRLVFHRCHANAANNHSQVGVPGGSGSGGSTGGARVHSASWVLPVRLVGAARVAMNHMGCSPPGWHSPSFFLQVSLVAVNLMGDLLEPLSPITNTGAPYGPGGPMLGAGMPGSGTPFQQQQPQQQPYHQQPQPQQQPQQAPSLAEVVAALAAEMGVDTVTAQRIHDLQQQKQQVGAVCCCAGFPAGSPSGRRC